MTLILPDKLKRFIGDFEYVAALAERERDLLREGGEIFRLALCPDLLPEAFGRCDASRPKFFRLYADAFARFVPASLALAPNQEGPVLPAARWRMAGVLSGTVLRRAEGGAEATLTAGQMEIARAGAAQFVNLSAVAPALMLFAFKPGDIAAFGFDNAPDTPPFDISAIEG